MMTLATVLLAVALLLFAVLTCFAIRNLYVYRFKMRCIDAAYNVVCGFYDSLKEGELILRNEEYMEIDRLKRNVCDMSYERMLFSFKPLKLRYWFTPEEIEFLKKGGME